MADDEDTPIKVPDAKLPRGLQVTVRTNPPVSDIRQEPWFVKQWRPLAAYTYLVICIFDFMIAPIGMGVLAVLTKAAYIAWVPLTIQGASMFHLAFGTIIGLYSWGRTKERIAGVEEEGAGVSEDYQQRDYHREEEPCEDDNKTPPRRGSRRKPRGG